MKSIILVSKRKGAYIYGLKAEKIGTATSLKVAKELAKQYLNSTSLFNDCNKVGFEFGTLAEAQRCYNKNTKFEL